MNPIPGTTVDTSPSVLGLQPKPSVPPSPASEGDEQEEKGGLLSRTLDKLSRSKSLSNKKSSTDRKVSSGGSSSNRHSKRLSMSGISLGRRKPRTSGENEESGAEASNRTDVSGAGTPKSEPPNPVASEAQSTAASEASSRAETPPPVAYPSRAAFGALGGAFKGDGSMRAGTQTLIQALQAIPWEEDRDEDAVSSERPSIGTRRESAISSGSDDDDNEGRRDFMASSIHAIYRPVARSNRGTPATARPNKGKSRLGVPAEGYFSPTSESEAPDDELDDLEEESHEDFDLAAAANRPPPLPLAAKYDPTAPSPATTSFAGSLHLLSPEGRGSPAPFTTSPISGLPPKLLLPNQTRQDSLATVRSKRKARLAEKLREVFGLREVEEVIAEMPCWLLRSVLLQGYMYLTSGHLCFFAHMPAREDQVLKSGSLAKKASRTKRWSKHWYVLKNDVLSWYQSSADPYFPHGNVDLRYAITCEAYGERDFKLRTNQKILHLQADSIPSRDEWVKAIKKVIFKAQNHGDSVKISLPFAAIIDIEKSGAMDFSDTIEVKVVDKDDNYAIDSYFFAYFHNLPAALVQIKEVIQAYKDRMEMQAGAMLPSATVRDTTTAVRGSVLQAVGSTGSTGSTATTVSAPGGSIAHFASAPPTVTTAPASPSATTSRLSHFTSLLGLSRGSSAPTPSNANTTAAPDDDFTHISYAPAVGGTNLASGRLSTDTTSRHTVTPANFRDDTSTTDTPRPGSVRTLQPVTSIPDHTYPPHTDDEADTFHHINVHDSQGNPVGQSSSSLAGYVPALLKAPYRKIFGTSSGGVTGSQESAFAYHDDASRVKEVYESRVGGAMTGSHTGSSIIGGSGGTGDSSNQLGFSILEAPGSSDGLDPLVVDKFRSYFALDEKEQLLGYFPGYLFRVLPLFGRIYVSTNCFCYRSGQPLRKTLMKIPLRDIISTEPSKAFRFGHHGLVIIIKGHEELFFEFNSIERRAALVDLLDKQIEDVQRRLQTGEPEAPSQSKKDALILEELEPAGYLGESASYTDGPRPPPESDTLPAVMFTSNSSTFLAFKPTEKMHITCLTIGSRGDCQPYIALCKRLQQDGHTCRIATHEEYKDWVEGHGIQFTAVGGDPAELMRICVENGMFTVGFLKETLQKFRGWLDDLLVTSWKACQGTDLLIESPSAMAGIHIAEALRIPYFRAFTMPFTRTRAYPHAFAVPERKMGGSYNYMTYVMFDQVFWRAMAGQINRWRRNILGISSTTFDKMEQHRVPFLYNFSPSVVPPPLDWYEWIRVTGYWFLDDPDDSAEKKWTPPADLVSFIDTAHQLGKKVIYIGFGSIVVSDPEAMTRAVVESVEQSGVYAILSKGWSDRLATKKNNVHPEVPEIKLPPQIYPIKSIPHDWLFPRIDAACHHGGAGTTGASLRAGIPTIIKPFFGDQFFWGDRVEALDVGSSVRKLTVDSLTEAIRLATTDVKQIEKAKLLGQKIRAEKGVDNAVEAIYRDLEYARSLIKQPSTPEHEPLEVAASSSRVDATPDRSVTDSSANDSKEGTSEWSVISGEEGEDRLERRFHPRQHGDRSPSPVPNPKRVSLGSALTAISSAIPKPSLGKRLSYDSRSSDRQESKAS
ncbi:Sterol 3-beta-glucosyltransferase [Tulasnella sp. 425]|nr:Sterol 3-beta-glucosyltransferase [Tulasnella sp. 425]